MQLKLCKSYFEWSNYIAPLNKESFETHFITKDPVFK